MERCINLPFHLLKGFFSSNVFSIRFYGYSWCLSTFFNRDRESRHINANSLISDSSNLEDPTREVVAGDQL